MADPGAAAAGADEAYAEGEGYGSYDASQEGQFEGGYDGEQGGYAYYADGGSQEEYHAQEAGGPEEYYAQQGEDSQQEHYAEGGGSQQEYDAYAEGGEGYARSSDDLALAEAEQQLEAQGAQLEASCYDPHDGDPELEAFESESMASEEESQHLAELRERYRRCRMRGAIHLDVSRMHVTAVPEQVMLKFGMLRTLNLRRNLLAEVPLELFTGLPLLEELDLAHNMLADLPQHLRLMTVLEKLDLSHNNFGAIPVAVYSLAALRELRMEHCRLKRIERLITQITTLQTLRLRENQIDFVHAEVDDMRLGELDLAGNEATLRRTRAMLAQQERFDILHSAKWRKSLIKRVHHTHPFVKRKFLEKYIQKAEQSDSDEEEKRSVRSARTARTAQTPGTAGSRISRESMLNDPTIAAFLKKKDKGPEYFTPASVMLR
mmetsp:Transcript_2105/g.6340  ORF Transcript_2105/g.6340 Transcript_2105/m.6340 type:complete len:433 (-) Transcript_2105:1546-2844(-)